MWILKLFKFFRKSSDTGAFLYKNFFSILKFSLRAIGEEDDDSKSFDKISKDQRLQQKFSKFFYYSYKKNFAEARSRDTEIVKRNGKNIRADILFYAIIFGFLISSSIVIFFKNRLSTEGIALFSAIAGICGGCLREIFHFEFGDDSIDFKSKEYVLDECERKYKF